MLDKSDYFSKLDVIINDTSKFEKVVTTRSNAKHPVLKRQEGVRDAINSLLEGYITEEVYKKLIPKGSGPGKIIRHVQNSQKKGNLMRPVLSMIGTAKYQLTKFLDSLIKPNLPDSFMLNSTDDFLEKLNKFPIQPGDKCLSFDVCSLFTNVPLTETIQIVADHLYSDKAVLTPTFGKKLFYNFTKTGHWGYFLVPRCALPADRWRLNGESTCPNASKLLSSLH